MSVERSAQWNKDNPERRKAIQARYRATHPWVPRAVRRYQQAIMGGDLLQVISTNYPHHRTARARLARLSDERRLEIEQGFERHKRACRSLGIKPDPQWVVEALMETEAERK